MFEMKYVNINTNLRRRRAFARNVEILFIALVVSRSFDTFAVKQYVYCLPSNVH